MQREHCGRTCSAVALCTLPLHCLSHPTRADSRSHQPTRTHTCAFHSLSAVSHTARALWPRLSCLSIKSHALDVHCMSLRPCLLAHYAHEHSFAHTHPSVHTTLLAIAPSHAQTTFAQGKDDNVATFKVEEVSALPLGAHHARAGRGHCRVLRRAA